MSLGNGPSQTLCVGDVLKTLPTMLTTPEPTVTFLLFVFPVPASLQRAKMVKLSFPRTGDGGWPAGPNFMEMFEIEKESGFSRQCRF